MRYNRFRPCCYGVLRNISQPQCIQLSEFSPNADDIVMYYVDGVHYETLLHFNEDFV